MGGCVVSVVCVCALRSLRRRSARSAVLARARPAPRGFAVFAVARRLGDAEFGLVRVRRLVQIDVARPLGDAARLEQAHEARGLLGAAGRRVAALEGTIRVDGVRIPALDVLVAPGRHARRDDDVEAPGRVGEGVRLQEPQRAVDARRLVAVDAAGDQDGRLGAVPVLGFHGVDRVRDGSIVSDFTVFDDVEGRAQRVEGLDDVVLVAARLDALAAPLRDLRRAPLGSRLADVVGARRGVGRHEHRRQRRAHARIKGLKNQPPSAR